MDLKRSQKTGQAALEYMLILTVVAVVVFLAIKPSGSPSTLNKAQTAAEGYYNTVTEAIMGKNPQPINGGLCPPKPNGQRECACPQPAFGGAPCTAPDPTIIYCGDGICNGSETGQPGSPFTCHEDCGYIPDCTQCGTLVPSATCGAACGAATCSALQTCMSSDCAVECPGFVQLCQDNPDLCYGSCSCPPGGWSPISACGVPSGPCVPTELQRCFQNAGCAGPCTPGQTIIPLEDPSCAPCAAESYGINCGPGIVTLPAVGNHQTSSIQCPLGCETFTMRATCIDGTFGEIENLCKAAVCLPQIYVDQANPVCDPVSIPVTSPGKAVFIPCEAGCDGGLFASCLSGMEGFKGSVVGNCTPGACEVQSVNTKLCGPVSLGAAPHGGGAFAACPAHCYGTGVSATCFKRGYVSVVEDCVPKCPETPVGTPCGNATLPITETGPKTVACPGTCAITGEVCATCVNGVWCGINTTCTTPPTCFGITDCTNTNSGSCPPDPPAQPGTCSCASCSAYCSGFTRVVQECPAPAPPFASCVPGAAPGCGGPPKAVVCPGLVVNTGACGSVTLPGASEGQSSSTACPGECTGQVTGTCIAGSGVMSSAHNCVAPSNPCGKYNCYRCNYTSCVLEPTGAYQDPNCLGTCPATCAAGAWVDGACGGGTCTAGQRLKTRACAGADCGTASCPTTQCVSDETCVPTCNPAAWAPGACGAGGCAPTQRQETRTCVGIDCGTLSCPMSRCVADAVCAPICNTGAWVDGACMSGGCGVNQRQQTRTCVGTDCDSPTCPTSQCVADAACSATCTAGAWVDGVCGGGGCAATLKSQTRVCAGADCGTATCPTSRCVTDTACLDCTPGAWASGSCGAGGCAPTLRQQTRGCVGSLCGTAACPTSQCVDDGACEPFCYANNWTSGSCGGGACADSVREETRTCIGSACGTAACPTSQCVADASCVCNTGTYTDVSCGGSGAAISCPLAQMYQTRPCVGTECNDGILGTCQWERCINHTTCCDIGGWVQGGCAVAGCAANEMYWYESCSGVGCGTAGCFPASGCWSDTVNCPTCSDGVQNGGEAGVDCGGSCPACPSCSDGIQNQGETGIDCGGPCPACPTCSDGIQNQGEAGVDCGGPCPACPPPPTPCGASTCYNCSGASCVVDNVSGPYSDPGCLGACIPSQY